MNPTANQRNQSQSLTPSERKELLGRGGLSDVARALGLTIGHVSEVNFERRRHAIVERTIADVIVHLHPEIDRARVWPFDVPADDGGNNTRNDLSEARKHALTLATQGPTDVPGNDGAGGTAPKKSRAIR